jgi:dTDP-4-dehydrorhamnose reductase
MRVLVFGQTGQVARELMARAPANMVLTALGRDKADLSDPATCAAVVQGAAVDAVINAATIIPPRKNTKSSKTLAASCGCAQRGAAGVEISRSPTLATMERIPPPGPH